MLGIRDTKTKDSSSPQGGYNPEQDADDSRATQNGAPSPGGSGAEIGWYGSKKLPRRNVQDET